MRRGLAREARRRPDMDLLVGPLEAAEPDPPTDPVRPDPFDIDAAEDRPAWREDG
jgi:hypothetical protein